MTTQPIRSIEEVEASLQVMGVMRRKLAGDPPPALARALVILAKHEQVAKRQGWEEMTLSYKDRITLDIDYRGFPWRRLSYWLRHGPKSWKKRERITQFEALKLLQERLT